VFVELMTQRHNLAAWMLELVVAAGIVFCGSNRGPSPSEPGQPALDGGALRPGAVPGAPAALPATGSGADASAAACDFRVGESCFASDGEACAAAGCKPGGCIVLESYPAQVSCK
jgi:hypothetical protein